MAFCVPYASRNVTMAGLRRLLEEDLKLDKYALDPFKKFISQHLDEVRVICYHSLLNLEVSLISYYYC